MEKKASYFIVGSFVMLAFAGILLFTLWIAGSDLDRKMSYYYIYFRGAVTGLLEGSNVNYNGVPIGTVKKIVIDPEDVEQVRVTVGIKSNIPIKEDSSAMLEMQGLTGYVVVQISGGKKESALLKTKHGQKYPIIPFKPSNFQELIASAPEALDRANKLLNRLSNIVDEKNQKAFSELLANLNEASQSFKTLIPEMKGAVKDFRDSWGGITHNTQEALAQIRVTAETINDVGKNIKDVLIENREGISSFSGQGLYELEETIVEAKDTFESLSSAIQRFEANPSGFILPSTQKGFVVPER
ncbi:MlaD family protein [Candidatus Bealeia paramacronuclearis]|uniref:MlaD family protein n=1 Tax=Candidatus Bealeia paramacronuclearis TaxID=1921001 RepID=A0ABZ2C1G7_9PROT|nr:MlaD family protein [Candidatus Bealeia paramacronuclearis]